MLTETQILTGHECCILSISWCHQDADLLLSCGKDNCALCWNPQTLGITGEVYLFYLKLIDIISNIVIATNSRQLSVPSFLVSTNSRAARIDILWRHYWHHTLQSTNDFVESRAPVPTPKLDGSDVFDVPGFFCTTQPTLSLKLLPK